MFCFFFFFFSTFYTSLFFGSASSHSSILTYLSHVKKYGAYTFRLPGAVHSETVYNLKCFMIEEIYNSLSQRHFHADTRQVVTLAAPANRRTSKTRLTLASPMVISSEVLLLFTQLERSVTSGMYAAILCWRSSFRKPKNLDTRLYPFIHCREMSNRLSHAHDGDQGQCCLRTPPAHHSCGQLLMSVVIRRDQSASGQGCLNLPTCSDVSRYSNGDKVSKRLLSFRNLQDIVHRTLPLSKMV
uniref:Putative secreted protein n=1 Tax=Rhipicephalus microplus TaxID=6941 RepID=A0A6M2D7T1_RHIMP